MNPLTPADLNPALAIAIGRFSQACNQLEDQLNFLLTRILPVTTNMGRVLFVGNQLRRNTEILEALLKLPELQISPSERERLSKIPARIRSLNDDRSKFLHNPMIGGSAWNAGEQPDPLILAVQRKDGAAIAFPISVEMINGLTAEAKALWTDMYTAPVSYDLSQWGSAFPAYAVQPYPKASQPKAGNRKARRQSARQGQAPIDATQGSGEEPPR